MDHRSSLQEDPELGCHIEVKTRDGETYTGILRSYNKSYLKLETLSHLVRIANSDISILKQPKEEKTGPSSIAEVLHNGHNGHQEENVRRELEVISPLSHLTEQNSSYDHATNNHHNLSQDSISEDRSSNHKHTGPTKQEKKFKLTLPDEEVQKEISKIETRFSEGILKARLDISTPKFVLSQEELQGRNSAEKNLIGNKFSRIKSSYEYAIKMQETAPQFGRIQPIIGDLQELITLLPDVACLPRYLAYCYILLEDVQKALSWSMRAARILEEKQDLHNTAVLAIKVGNITQACIELAKLFQCTALTDYLDDWYIFIQLLHKQRQYSLLRKIWETSLRAFSQKEEEILLESMIYLLKMASNEQAAQQVLRTSLEEKLDHPLLLTAFNHLMKHAATFASQEEVSFEAQQEGGEDMQVHNGHAQFSSDQGPLLKQAQYYYNKRDYCNALHILRKLSPHYPGVQQLLELSLQARKKQNQDYSQRDTISQDTRDTVSAEQTEVDNLFAQAKDCLRKGDPSNAINRVKRVLEINAEYPGAQALLEHCRETQRQRQTQAGDSSRGPNYFAQAQWATSHEEAIKSLRLAIEHGQRVPSAAKDLAHRLAKIGQGHEAIEVLENHRQSITDQQSVDNVLIQIYIKLKQYAEALKLLEKKIAMTSPNKRGAEMLRQIADCYLGLGNYSQAKPYLQEVIQVTTENKAAQKRLALCYIKEQRYHDAEQILSEVLKISPDDAQARELLEDATHGRTSETTIDLSDTSHEISKFARFFLDRCEFRGVPSARLQGGKLDVSDIKRLEKLAEGAGYAGNYSDLAEFYLSAARIVLTNEDLGDQTALSRFLLRSFASRGDASVGSKPLDTIREWYCEALSLYDGTPKSEGSETDTKEATNALVRFLYATLESREAIALPRGANYAPPSVDHALRDVWSQTTQAFRFFDLLAYLTSRSRRAKDLLLPRIFEKSEPRTLMFSYLRKRLDLAALSSGEQSRQKLEDLWGKLDTKNQTERVRLYTDLNLIAQFEFKQSWLEETINRIEMLKAQLFFQLDRRRVGQQLHSILDLALRFCKEVSFEEREYSCRLIDDYCQSLLDEISKEPTKLSVERLYGIVERIQAKTKDTLKQVYESSMPQITISQALPSYIPDRLERVTVQIAIANGEYCSPAESIELEVSGETCDTFILEERRFPLEKGSLRGGQKETVLVPVQVTGETKRAEAFSLLVSVSYRTRSGEPKHTPQKSLDVRLYPEHLFEEIANPYFPHAESGPVEDPAMFYGREKLITNVAKMLCEGLTHAKSIVLFGQKRAGKSSILYHLKLRLEQEAHLLVLNIDNIGDLIDHHSATPLLYQILWRILDELGKAIEQKSGDCDERLQLALPTLLDFYEHPTPLVYFREIFKSFQHKAKETSQWKDIHVVLLFDEFQYIYDLIIQGKLSKDFMKNWKALLQQNFFSVVLVGQDVMTKFIENFQNEFGTTQNERVSYLRAEDAQRLIDEPIRIGGMEGEKRYLEGAIKHILDLTAGNPYYIQIVCHRLVEHLNRKRAIYVTKADVDQVKSEMVRGKDALSEGHFDNLITSGDPAEDKAYRMHAIKIMACIAKKSQLAPCSRDEIDCELGVDIDTIVEDLVRRDVIQPEPGRRYTLRVGLFKEWLIARYC